MAQKTTLIEPNQSIKLTIVRGQSTINNLASDQKEKNKRVFQSLDWQHIILECQSISRLSNRPKNVKRSNSPHLLVFLPTKEPCQLRRISLTEEGNTQDTPNKTLVFEQWRRRWPMVSSFSRHMKHLFANARPLFWTISKVKPLPHVASHAKKLILDCTLTRGWYNFFFLDRRKRKYIKSA